MEKQTVKTLTISGKRKTAIAKATIKSGEGKIWINKIPYENLDFLKNLMIKEPVEITKKVLGNFNFNIQVRVKGGGEESQTEEGEALRKDDEFSYVAVWEHTGDGKEPNLHKEPLEFEHVKLAQRSYK